MKDKDLIRCMREKSMGMEFSTRWDVLELARRFETALEDLKMRDTEIDILIRKNETLKDEVSELQCKNASCNAEIEMLKEAYIAYEETTGLKQAKAEAIKEFIAKAKCYAYYIDYPTIHRVIDEDDLDNLVKEMVGDAE